MLARLLLALVGLASPVLAAPLASLEQGQTGRIEFNSITPPDRFQYVRRNLDNTRPVTVYGDLHLPKTTGRVPALIYSHGSTGLLPLAVEVWSKAMNDAGFAIFFIDSFVPRGFGRIADNQFALDPATSIADAMNALALLASHPRIDSNRIYNIGFSRGGGVAFSTAWPMYQRPVDTNGVKFAGHIAVYPGGTCEIRYRADKSDRATAPILIALGTDDTIINEQTCKRLAKELIDTGNQVITKTYQGARHGFDVPNPYGSLPNSHHGYDCDIEVEMVDRQGVGLGKARDIAAGRAITTFGEWNDAIGRCMKRSDMTYGGLDRQRKLLIEDVINFVNTSR